MMTKDIKSFKRWKYDFVINGEHTLDPEKARSRIRRTEGRRALFMEPLIQSGFLRGKRVLDLGCNAGYWSLCALEGGAAFVLGLDAAPELIEQAEFVFSRLGVDESKYQFELCDLFDFLREREDRFDVVLCLGLLYHIDEPMNLLKLIFERLDDMLIIDTVVCQSNKAMISLRPTPPRKRLLASAKIGLELAPSPKAVHWMAMNRGFAHVRTLRGEFSRFSPLWQYATGRRMAFAMTKNTRIEEVFKNVSDETYPNPSEDAEHYIRSRRKRRRFPLHRWWGRWPFREQ
jgi:SAM-dependent methyltransferase